MRSAWWAGLVVVAGLVGVAVTLLVEAGVLPPVARIVPMAVVPLLALGAGFAGVAASSAVVAGPLVMLTALVVPIVDLTTRSQAAGNLDDARGHGLVTGLALAGVGALAAASTVRRARRRSRAEALPVPDAVTLAEW